MNMREKEIKLIEQLEKAKQQLAHLQTKRRYEIGKLAYQCGLDQFDDSVLKNAFIKIAKELSHDHPKANQTRTTEHRED